MNWLNHTKPGIIDPRSVDLEDHTYLIPCFSDLWPLTKSIEKLGILNVPLVQRLADGRMIPVAGRRRLQCAAILGLDQVSVKALPSDMPVADGFTLAFWDNASHRVFDTAAAAVIVRRLLELFPKDIVARDFLPVLGIAPKGPRLERLRSIGGLEHSILEALFEGHIREKTAALLCEMASETRQELLALTEKLHLNANKSAEMISWLFDLSVLKSKPIPELLSEKEAESIITDGDMPLPERAERFRELVRSWKFPELAARENKFKEWTRQLSQPHRVSVRPTPAFEDPGCAIEIKAASADEAQRIVSILKQHLEP